MINRSLFLMEFEKLAFNEAIRFTFLLNPTFKIWHFQPLCLSKWLRFPFSFSLGAALHTYTQD